MIHCYILLTSSSHIVVKPFSFNLPCIITLFTISIHCVTYNRIHMNKRQYIAGQFVQTTRVINSRWQCFSFHRSISEKGVFFIWSQQRQQTYLRWNFQICLFKMRHCCSLRLKVAAKNSGRFCLPLAQTILIGSRFLWRHTGFP